MADIELVIKIDEERYKRICSLHDNMIFDCDDPYVAIGIKNGQILPKGQEPKTGHWIELGCVGNDNYNFECSECHHTDTQSKAVKVNYCWYCGAKMVEPQESEVQDADSD